MDKLNFIKKHYILFSIVFALLLVLISFIISYYLVLGSYKK